MATLTITPTFDPTCTAKFEACVKAAIATIDTLFSPATNLTVQVAFSEASSLPNGAALNSKTWGDQTSFAQFD
jgi:hypothetical protein